MFNCITSDSKSRQLRYKNIGDFHWNLLQKSSTGKIISEQDRNVTFSTISTTYYKLKNNWLGLTLKLSVLTQWCSWENVDHDRNEHKNFMDIFGFLWKYLHTFIRNISILFCTSPENWQFQNQKQCEKVINYKV